MKRALVLSGGAARGAYQIGVWKALRKLKIKFDIVTGTSVGALNGAFVVQDDFIKAYHMWRTINYQSVFPEAKEIDDEGALKNYKLLKERQSTKGIEKLIDDYLNITRFYKSTIDFGVVVTELSSLKPLYLTKKEIKPEQLKNYLVGTATLFPVFKIKEVGKQSLIDGGYHDNLPINLAIKMGATEIIAVDLAAIGRVPKITQTNIKLTIIKPNNQLDSILEFNQESIKRAIALGYNDTLKKFQKVDGHFYTFKKDHLTNNYKYYKKRYQTILNKNVNFKSKLINQSIISLFNQSINNEDTFNQVIETTAKLLKIDIEPIYRINFFNFLLCKEIKKINQHQLINLKLNNDLKQLLEIYEILNQSNTVKKQLKRYIITKPKLVLAAIYLKTIEKRRLFF